MYLYIPSSVFFLALGHMCKKFVLTSQHGVVFRIGCVNILGPPLLVISSFFFVFGFNSVIVSKVLNRFQC